MCKHLATIVLAAAAVQGVAFAQGAPASNPRQMVLSLSKSGSLDLIDPGALKVIARIPAGGNPHEVIATPDGRRAYVSNYGNGTLNTITVVDLVARKPLATVNLGPIYGPHGLTFVGNRLWFTAEREKLIGRLAPDNSIEWELGTGQIGTHMLWVSEDGKSIVTVNVGSGTLSLITPYALPAYLEATPSSKYGTPVKRGTTGDAISDWQQSVIKVGTNPEGFDVLKDRQGHPAYIWAVNALEGTVSVIDVAAQRVAETIPAGLKSASRLRLTPDGRYALVAGEEMSYVAVLDVGARKLLKKIPVGTGGAAGIVMDPSGRKAYVSCSSDNKVAVIDLASLSVTGEIKTDEAPDGIAWANLDGKGTGVSP